MVREGALAVRGGLSPQMARTAQASAVACVFLVLLLIALADARPARAQDEGGREATAASEGAAAARPRVTPKRTGLPLPRFASLRASEVYMRTGPGTRYPVEWIYRRRGLPVQIIAEFDAWRKVRDWNGTVGWVHRAMLSGRRTAVTLANDTVLRRAPAADAPAVARSEPGVVARILKCAGAWCRIEARGIKGWVSRTALWGTLPGENVD
jgi:SH3-like domain-containing protein